MTTSAHFGVWNSLSLSLRALWRLECAELGEENVCTSGTRESRRSPNMVFVPRLVGPRGFQRDQFLFHRFSLSRKEKKREEGNGGGVCKRVAHLRHFVRLVPHKIAYNYIDDAFIYT